MKQRIAVITGATGGIGNVVCKYLIENNYKVYAACRNESKGEKLRKYIADYLLQKETKSLCSAITPKNNTSEKAGAIKPSAANLVFIPVDLKSFASVDEFCASVITALSGNTIDLLINNAGMIAPVYEITADGYESSMQVNYLSAKLLTETLLPHIKGKIINTVSCTIKAGDYTEPKKQQPPTDRKKENSFKSLKDYSNSKLMLALYTVRLCNAAHRNIQVLGVDPGIVNTGIITMHRWYDPLADLFFRPFIKTPEQGAIPLIRAIEHTGNETERAASPSTESSRITKNPLLFIGKRTRVFPNKIIQLSQSVL